MTLLRGRVRSLSVVAVLCLLAGCDRPTLAPDPTEQRRLPFVTTVSGDDWGILVGVAGLNASRGDSSLMALLQELELNRGRDLPSLEDENDPPHIISATVTMDGGQEANRVWTYASMLFRAEVGRIDLRHRVEWTNGETYGSYLYSPSPYQGGVPTGVSNTRVLGRQWAVAGYDDVCSTHSAGADFSAWWNTGPFAGVTDTRAHQSPWSVTVCPVGGGGTNGGGGGGSPGPQYYIHVTECTGVDVFDAQGNYLYSENVTCVTHSYPVF